MIGTTIGSYRIVDKLGEGAMGAVYRAVDVMLDREVAVKALRPDLSRQAALVERFRSEAVALARLNHPNIAIVHGLVQHEGQYYMVMEFVQGETLERIIERTGRLDWQRALEYCAAAADGLQHAHEHGVVHRDIKPSNLMLSRRGVVKVMDFGVARLVDRNRQTRTGMAVGTRMYMSPEQLRGHDVDGRTDVYALGAVLFELVTGRMPFDADSEYGLLMAQLNQPPPAPSSVLAGLPGPIDTIVARAMEKRPEDRYGSAMELRRALLAAVAQAAGEAGARVAAPQAPAPSPPAPAAAPSRRSSPPPAPFAESQPSAPGPAPTRLAAIEPERESSPPISTDEVAQAIRPVPPTRLDGVAAPVEPSIPPARLEEVAAARGPQSVPATRLEGAAPAGSRPVRPTRLDVSGPPSAPPTRIGEPIGGAVQSTRAQPTISARRGFSALLRDWRTYGLLAAGLAGVSLGVLALRRQPAPAPSDASTAARESAGPTETVTPATPVASVRPQPGSGPPGFKLPEIAGPAESAPPPTASKAAPPSTGPATTPPSAARSPRREAGAPGVPAPGPAAPQPQPSVPETNTVTVQQVVQALEPFTSAVGAGDASTVRRLWVGGEGKALQDVLELMKEGSLQIQAEGPESPVEAGSGRAQVELNATARWRTAFGSNRRRAIRLAAELERAGAGWQLVSVRILGTGLK